MSCLGGTNTGYLRVSSSAEVGTLYDTDGVTVLEENYFNSWNSQLWRRVRNTFSVDLENMYKTLRSNNLFTLENMLKYFDAVTDIISPKMYNDSQQIKYINDGAVGMVALHGNRKLQIRKWLRERIAYLDSKYGYYAGGGVGENYCNFRMNYQGAVSLDLTTYYTVYAKVRWATNNEQTIRISRGQKKTFSYYSDVGTDREVMIFLPEALKTIENISRIYPNSIDVSKATKLTKIEAHNTNLFSVDLSKNKYLRTVDFNGCERLGTETATMTLNFCKYLNKVDLRGTQITAVNFNTKGGSLREIYYPKTIQSVNLLNQLLLTDMVLPLGEDERDVAVGLATATIENCPNIVRMNDTNSNPTSLSGMKYCRNITFNNSIKLEKFNFYGFTRLANVNLQNMETLKEVDFLNMAEKGQETSLKYIGVSACPNLKKISMNCDDPNYEITWASNSLLDLQTAGGIEEITSNCIIKGLETIVIPRSIKGLYFTNEYGSGYSDIKNIWSAEASTIVKTGVFPVPYHLNSSNAVDEYEGIDFKGLNLTNIDLGALVQIPDAINFSLYPTHINPNFNLHRDGVTLPYLQPKGILDLSNYTASLAKFFNGVDLNKLILICSKQLPQSDLSYCFYNAIFDNENAITPLTDRLGEVTNLDYCFYKSVVGVEVLDRFEIGANASLNYTFGECNNISELNGLVIPPSVKSSEGLFFKCPIKTITNVKINTSGSCKELFKDNRKLTTITNLTMPNSTNFESSFENCVLLDELPFKEISDRVVSIAKMYYNCSNPTNIDNFSFGASIVDATDWINKDLITSANDVVIKNSSVNFEGFTNLTTCNNLLLTSNVKTMANFFKGDSLLSSLSLNVSSDLSNVTSMAYTLNGCTNLSVNPLSEIPDSVENMDYLYNGTAITDISGIIIGNGVTSATNWNPTNLRLANDVTIKNNVVKFTGITNLQYAQNLSRPNTTNWASFFEGCTSLKEDIDFPSTTTTVKDCYKGCTSLTHVHSNWLKIYSNGIISTDCYLGCTGITHIDDENTIAYVGDSGIDYIPAHWGGYGFENTTWCFEIITSKLSNGMITLSATPIAVNWGDGTNEVSATHTYSDLSRDYIIKVKFVATDNMDTYTWNDTQWLKKVYRIPFWKGGPNRGLGFRWCRNLEYVDFSNVKKVRAINSLLDGATIIKSENIIGLDNLVQAVYDFGSGNSLELNNMFLNCPAITTLDLSNWDVRNIINLTNFVGNCTDLRIFIPPKNINVSLSDFTNSIKLDSEQLIAIINNLNTVSTTQTLTLGSINLAKLTSDEIKIATDKGWTLI